MESEIIIRKARRDDIPFVHALIRELAEFEEAPLEVELTAAQLEQDCFGTKSIIEIIVADRNGEILGTAMFYEKYSTWKGRGVHLEDFIVKSSERRKGIGKLLFEEVIRIAKNRNYARMEWQVLDWNASAISFYKKYNAGLTNEWLDGRLTRNQIQD